MIGDFESTLKSGGGDKEEASLALLYGQNTMEKDLEEGGVKN